MASTAHRERSHFCRGNHHDPYGFVTSTLSRVKAERGQVAEIERIGWRALLASLAALAIAATLTVSLNLQDNKTDFEPGVRGLVQMDDISIS